MPTRAFSSDLPIEKARSRLTANPTRETRSIRPASKVLRVVPSGRFAPVGYLRCADRPLEVVISAAWLGFRERQFFQRCSNPVHIDSGRPIDADHPSHVVDRWI